LCSLYFVVFVFSAYIILKISVIILTISVSLLVVVVVFVVFDLRRSDGSYCRIANDST